MWNGWPGRGEIEDMAPTITSPARRRGEDVASGALFQLRADADPPPVLLAALPALAIRGCIRRHTVARLQGHSCLFPAQAARSGPQRGFEAAPEEALVTLEGGGAAGMALPLGVAQAE